jgi:hypothetical protein
MSRQRLNHMVMSGVLPFNFGMNYDDCLAFYDAHHGVFSELCPTDPRTWSEETVAQVNQRAAEQIQLYERLQSLPDAEYYAEMEVLEKNVKDE